MAQFMTVQEICLIKLIFVIQPDQLVATAAMLSGRGGGEEEQDGEEEGEEEL